LGTGGGVFLLVICLEGEEVGQHRGEEKHLGVNFFWERRNIAKEFDKKKEIKKKISQKQTKKEGAKGKKEIGCVKECGEHVFNNR